MKTTIENKMTIEFDNIYELRDFANILFNAIEADRISRLPEDAKVRTRLSLSESQDEMIKKIGKELGIVVGNVL